MRLEDLYAHAKTMSKRNRGSYETCKTILNKMALDYQEYEQAIRKIADILEV